MRTSGFVARVKRCSTSSARARPRRIASNVRWRPRRAARPRRPRARRATARPSSHRRRAIARTACRRIMASSSSRSRSARASVSSPILCSVRRPPAAATRTQGSMGGSAAGSIELAERGGRALRRQRFEQQVDAVARLLEAVDAEPPQRRLDDRLAPVGQHHPQHVLGYHDLVRVQARGPREPADHAVHHPLRCGGLTADGAGECCKDGREPRPAAVVSGARDAAGHPSHRGTERIRAELGHDVLDDVERCHQRREREETSGRDPFAR